MTDRQVLNVRLSPKSFEGYQQAADAHNVTVTALIESIGCYFADNPEGPNPKARTPFPGIIALARQITVTRRRPTAGR